MKIHRQVKYWLVMRNDEWYICRPGAVTENGSIRLCWCERDGSILCMSGEEERVEELPE